MQLHSTKSSVSKLLACLHTPNKSLCNRSTNQSYNLLLALCTFIFLSLPLIPASQLQAAETVMYKKIDKNGKVTFSDKPSPGAKKIVINTNHNLMSMPRVQKKSAKSNDQQPPEDGQEAVADNFNYQLLRIESPANDQAVRANDGNVYVLIAMTPRLKPSHSIRLLMDGQPIGAAQKVPYFSLSNINRGTHQLQAVVFDDQTNQTITRSRTSIFHLLKTSVINRPGR